MNLSKTIAYQGEPGANSHIACAENFPDYAPLPCATFEDAFAALQDGTADLGMIPIENSIAGRVAWNGYGYVQLERGWTQVISGTFAAGTGLVLVALGLILRDHNPLP